VISFFPGCAPKKMLHLEDERPVITYCCNFIETKENVTLRTKVISPEESRKLFKHNLLKRGFIPFEIGIDNQSPHTYIWRPAYIDTPLISSNIVIKKLKKNTWAWASALGIPLYLYINPYLAILSIPAICWYLGSRNQRVDKALSTNNVGPYDKISVAPYTYESFLICVDSSQLSKTFRIKLFNDDKKNMLSFAIGCKTIETYATAQEYKHHSEKYKNRNRIRENNIN
jgi:hypothetical protein